MTYHLQFSMSSAPNTIERAAHIITLAEHADGYDQDTLLGCAMLLLAVALDQALSTHLSMLSDFYQSTANPPPVPNPAEVLRKDSLKTRLFRTPEISHIYPARLKKDSDYVDYLTELIDRRNSLMHFTERPVSFDIETDQMPSNARVNLDSSLPSRIPILSNDNLTVSLNLIDPEGPMGISPWGNVTQAEAQRSLAAIQMYCDRVLSDPGPCEILDPL